MLVIKQCRSTVYYIRVEFGSPVPPPGTRASPGLFPRHYGAGGFPGSSNSSVTSHVWTSFWNALFSISADL